MKDEKVFSSVQFSLVRFSVQLMRCMSKRGLHNARHVRVVIKAKLVAFYSPNCHLHIKLIEQTMMKEGRILSQLFVHLCN